ncbi:uncharacterized protein LOC143622107 [Bidens hawaiensis]|uniref:uncharacterized protein LOC143622107 n=1 Tax=Bidens hawaiensis TaxID=980011 RepID=UPI00404929B5
MDNETSKKKHKLHCYNFLLDSTYTSDLVGAYYYKHIYKEPCMTSSQTGQAWIMEVLNDNPIRCVNAFRMHPNVFMKLCKELESNYGLQSSDRMSTCENVGIFLYTLALGLSNRDVRERFQCSGETISKAFHEVLEAISGRDKGFQGLARNIIRPKDPTFQFVPPQILNDKRYMPYFKGPASQRVNNYLILVEKGVPTFVMATCDFDMCFTFISIRWEGSAHDTRVFIIATQDSKFNFPHAPKGRYYLVDKGYPGRIGYLLYSKTRYHQSQFQREPLNNMQEAFNRSHSSLRSYIERSFGILKKRFKILGTMPKYSVKTQIDVIMATFALHNYTRNSQEDIMFTTMEQHPNYIPQDELHDVSNHDTSTSGLFKGTTNEMKHVRNNIATLIWNARQ